jgi:hypothetical protein
MTVYSSDGFSGAFGTTDGAGSKDPLTWTQHAGVWSTSGGQALTTSVANARASVDSTFADVTVYVTIKTYSTSQGICFRLGTTVTDYLLFTMSSAGAWVLSSVGTTAATLASGSGVTVASNDVLKVIANGTSIRAFINNTQIASVTSSTYQTNTKHGIFASSSTASRFDDFEIDNPHVIFNVTQTQTPTIRRALTLARATLTATNTQTPTISKPKTIVVTQTVTQTQTPTIDPLAGIGTTATGSESAPTWLLQVTDNRGTIATTLSNAEPDKITWTLNQPDDYTFHFPKNAYTEAQIPTIGTAAGGAKEVQIYRNGDLLSWGPVIGVTGSGDQGKLEAHGAGVDWFLNRRFIDGPITNLLLNADFESGTTGWTASNTTFTADTGNFVVGAKSAKLITTLAGSDTRIQQTVAPAPNGVGKLVTASAWFFIDSFTAPAFGWLGLLLEGYKDGVFQKNNYYPIDSATPRKQWTKAATTLWIPPNESWTIRVSLWGPQGTIHWDDCKVVAPESLSTAGLTGSVNTPVDIARIVEYIVDFMQSTAYGKSALNIGGSSATTGVTMTKHYQFVDHVQFDQAMREFIERDDGVDYYVKITPKTRTFKTFAGKRGTDRHASVTLKYDVSSPSTSNCTSYHFARDGGQCITRQTIIGEDNGPDREQGETADATQTGGVILQDVRQAPQGSKTASLQPLADERLGRYKEVPLAITMNLQGSSGLIPTIHCGDLVTVVISDGYVSVTGTYRIMTMTLDCPKNNLAVTVTKDDLS